MSCASENLSSLICTIRRQRYPQLVLEEDINFDSLSILLDNGLATRCREVYEGWRKQRDDEEAQFSQEERGAISGTRNQAVEIYRRLEAGLAEWLAEETVKVYS